MKLENQVVPLEQAKRLKELGIIQNEGYFKWSKHEGCNPILVDFWGLHCGGGLAPDIRDMPKHEGVWTAFTVAELGVMLAPLRHNPPGGNEAIARAAFLIRRLETGKTTAEECNTRLMNA